jgi:outer membrane receptor protein involved in Fe transport
MWVSALALTAGFTGVASAQEAGVTSEEIVVTAQLREQRLFEVPIAVTAYDTETLDRLGITKYDELALHVPGFEVQEQSANNPGFVIRGITSDSGEATTEPRVAVYQDGVSTSRSRGSYMELFDIERVEVARGPQATLYGRGALIGAVNVVQNKADLSAPEWQFQLGAGEDNYRRALVVLNAPIVQDTLAARVAGTLRARDGYVENLAGGEDLGGVDVAAGRVALAFEPAHNLRFDLIGNIHNDSNAGTPFKSGTFAPTGGDTSPYSPAALNTWGGFEDGRSLGLDREVRALTLLANWDISPSLTLTSITGGREFEAFEVFDPDGSEAPLIVAAEDAEGEQFSQEIRLAWDNGGVLSGFAGVSYFHEEGSQRTPTQYDERYALAFASGQMPGPAVPSLGVVQAIDTAVLNTLITSTQGLQTLLSMPVTSITAAQLLGNLNATHTEEAINYGETTSWEAFADATWRVTDRFEITAGVRYTQDEKTSGLEASAGSPSALGNILAAQALLEAAGDALGGGQTVLAQTLTGQASGILTSVAFGAPALPSGLFTQPQAYVEQSGEFDAWTWRLVGRYELSDDVALWASYARGRRPEVISLSPGNLPGSTYSSNALPAEQVDSFEVGMRGQGLLSNTLDLEGSVYYYDYTDFQTTEFDGLSIITVNAGEASAYGFEGAANWRPFDGLRVFGTYSYNHSRFESGAREGNSFRLSPDHSASIGFNYELPLGSAGNLFITPAYTWQSKIFFDDNNDRTDLQPEVLPGLQDTVVNEFQDSYGLLSLRAGFEHASGHWTLEGFVTNALDEEYLIDAGNTGDSFTIPTFIRGAPRLVGAELTVRF